MRPVVWSINALHDNLEILRYVADDNPFAAEQIVDAIDDAGKKLADFAVGRPGRVNGTFEKPLVRHPYILVYAILDMAGVESVVILRVIHTSREWPTTFPLPET